MAKPQKTSAELFAAQALASQLKKELTQNILPYWMNRMSRPEGGFHGRIDGYGNIDTEAPVGNIMTARILWTYSSAYRLLGKEEYLEMAIRAKNLIIKSFYDKENGGTIWSSTPDGSPHETKKQIYAIAFTIYGLAELNRATGDGQAIEYAIKLFNSIEDHSFDTVKGGYLEAFARDWSEIEDMRLSEKDFNDKKTTNTHLHILEAYTNLFRVWRNSLLEERLKGLTETFLEKIISEDGHLRLFFDEDWNCTSDLISYGHDIEASWLIHEAALVLGDTEILARVEKIVPAMAAAASEGFTPEGGMIYERTSDTIDGDRHWWVQAESVAGYFNLWDSFGIQEGLENALCCWEFIKAGIIDHKGGEWFWSLRADDTVNREDDKAGFWKCPYHNGRMCLEIIERTSKKQNPQ